MIEPVARRAALILLPVVVCGLASCRSKTKSSANVTEEEPPILASVVDVADPRVTGQLVSGFYGVEQNSWRWTAKRFAVLLRPPPTAAVSGANLKLNFAVPEVLIGQLRSVSLSASIRGTLLAPEAYTKPGRAVYVREVPGGLLSGDSVRVDFTLDKALPPGNVELRELGIIASRISFEAR